MQARLTELSAMPEAEGRPDMYGAGEPVGALEARVAKLLGKPTARFVIKGVIAQQARCGPGPTTVASVRSRSTRSAISTLTR